jgi:ribosomal protein L11 methyltransferase
MDYIELALETYSKEQAEILMAELAEYPFESFDQQEALLKAYIPQKQWSECNVEVHDMLSKYDIKQVLCRKIVSEDWNAVWERDFTPVCVDERLTIRAPFHEPSNSGMEVIIMPRMSFGTGHHITTCLMAVRLLDQDIRGLRGLDMGSGTGVLSIIAAKCGATEIDAVDIDAGAYENCIDNIQANNVDHQIVPLLGGIEKVSERHYDFILANINRNILQLQLPFYANMLKKGGWLSMSGFLDTGISLLTESALRVGFSLCGSIVRDGWARVDVVRN